MKRKMNRKNEALMQNEAAIDELVQKKLKEYVDKRTPKVETEDGQTYISFGAGYAEVYKTVDVLLNLIGLLGVERDEILLEPIQCSDTYYFGIDGDNQERAEFIRRFIENGYKLTL